MLFTLGILLHSRVISLNTGKCECVQEISSADMKRGYVYTPSHFRTYFGCPTRYNTLLKIEDMQKVRAFTLSILLLSRWRQTENMTKVGRKKFEDMNRNTELRTLESGCTCVCVCVLGVGSNVRILVSFFPQRNVSFLVCVQREATAFW